jgi:ABC-type cobalamin/Fe3+-siderophores transport system ATPase subunit
VGDLSGGERNRVHLAKVMKGRHNVILLDEPTNDLGTCCSQPTLSLELPTALGVLEAGML